MRYQFIREHQHEFSVQRMCRVLEVTRSGYYAWQPEKTGPRKLENQVLVEQIRKEYKTSRHTYGSPRIWAALQGQGVACGRHRVARLMRRRRHPASKTTEMASCHHPTATWRHPGTEPFEPRLLCHVGEYEMGE